MKTKLEMAHDCALAYIKYSDGKTHYKDVVEFAWRYADAMQAEADKCKPSGLPDALKEEWQPDWSQAPEWANWWAMDKDGEYYFFENKPEMESVTWMPRDVSEVNRATSFNYQGNWKDSLRERPE